MFNARARRRLVAALARALRCTDAERDHLYRLAGQAPPTPGTIHRHLGPGIQRMLDRLSDVPVIVVDAAWQVQARRPGDRRRPARGGRPLPGR